MEARVAPYCAAMNASDFSAFIADGPDAASGKPHTAGESGLGWSVDRDISGVAVAVENLEDPPGDADQVTFTHVVGGKKGRGV